MFDDLSLDVIQSQIDASCLLALFFSSVFRIPKNFGDGLFVTELDYRGVGCYSSHNGNNTVFLLVSVHVEQHLKCTSHHLALLDYKISYQ